MIMVVIMSGVGFVAGVIVGHRAVLGFAAATVNAAWT
jgi:hypothetical protein